jgi:hypothetical protein
MPSFLFVRASDLCSSLLSHSHSSVANLGSERPSRVLIAFQRQFADYVGVYLMALHEHDQPIKLKGKNSV